MPEAKALPHAGPAEGKPVPCATPQSIQDRRGLAGPLTPPNETYGWFSRADVRFLIEALRRTSREEHKVILVGGQAVALWALYYKISLPDTGAPFLTQDADLFGSTADADLLTRELGGTIKKPGLDDSTPNSAKITFTGPSGTKLLIDMLWNVFGLKDKEVRSLAISLAAGDMPAVSVLHPLLCLQSRCENLYGLSHKRTRISIAQAKVAIDVARAFVNETLARNARQALKAAWRIADIAQSRAGVFIYSHYRLDVLEAVEVDRFDNPEFRERSWPDRASKILRKREIADRRQSR